MLDMGNDKTARVARAMAPSPLRRNRYLPLFYTLGLVGTVLALFAQNQRFFFIGSAWCVAGATTITLWVGVETVRYLLNETQHSPWPGESWLPLRGRWLRLLVFTPLLVPGLVFVWLAAMLVRLEVTFALRMVLWP